jgi:hypothetical protein
MQPNEPANAWWTYVQATSENSTPSTIARKIGVNQSSVWRWQETSPSVAGARAFALGYARPVLEAFVAAGFLTPDEAYPVAQDPRAELRQLSERLIQLSEMTEEHTADGHHRYSWKVTYPLAGGQVVIEPKSAPVKPAVG